MLIARSNAVKYGSSKAVKFCYAWYMLCSHLTSSKVEFCGFIGINHLGRKGKNDQLAVRTFHACHVASSTHMEMLKCKTNCEQSIFYQM